MSIETCPNCQKELKQSLLFSNKLLSPDSIAVINAVNNNSAIAYCEKCGNGLLTDALPELRNCIELLRNEVLSEQLELPVVSINSPYGWEYKVIGLATSQSVTGTGVSTEISMTINDLFGTESGTMNTKLKDAENACISRMRNSAVEMGGNAVIGVSINYSEIGSLRGMMMVCCTGTVIHVTNAEVCFGDANSSFQTVKEKRLEIKRLEAIYNDCELVKYNNATI